MRCPGHGFPTSGRSGEARSRRRPPASQRAGGCCHASRSLGPGCRPTGRHDPHRSGSDFSGAVGWPGPIRENAVQMAIDDQGPVKGFPASVIVAEGGCQDAMGTAAAQTMMADPAIVGVIGHTCSASCGAGAPVYEGAHLVMISPSCTGPDLSGPGYQVFDRVAIRDDQGGDGQNAQVVNPWTVQKRAFSLPMPTTRPASSCGPSSKWW